MSLGPFWTAVILPPPDLLLFGLAGVAVTARSPRWGRRIAVAALCGLAVLALPFTADRLAASIAAEQPPAAGQPPPGAVVILAAEVRRVAGAANATDVGPLTLERLRRGAALARATALPILVTGGAERPGEAATATLMAASLRDDFGVAARWVETASQDTMENATGSAAILRAQGVARVYLVTHAWHMRRSELAFRKAGIDTVAAPVRVERTPSVRLADFVPRPEAWVTSLYSLHEWLGFVVYSLR